MDDDIGKDVLCIKDGLYRGSREETGLKAYLIYKVTGISISGGFFLEGFDQGMDAGFGRDRFIDVTDWPEEDKIRNRA